VFDNDCDGATDEGCAPACGESSVGPVRSAETESPTNLFGTPWTLGVAWSADASELGVVYVWQETSGSTLIAEEVRLLRFGADATLRGQTVLARTPGAYPNQLGGLAWNGERWIATWRGYPTTGDRSIARIYASLALADGRPIGEPVAITSGARPAEHPRVLAVGRELYFAWAELAAGGVEPTNVHAAHYDGALRAIAPDIVLGPGTGWIDLAWSGDALGVLDVSSRRDVLSTTARFTLLRDDAIVAQDQQVVSDDSAELRPPALAFGGGGFLGCWAGTADPFVTAPVRCAHIGAAGGFLGAAFDTTRPASILFGDVAWNGCRFVVYSARRDPRAGYEQYVAIVGPAGGGVESSSTLPYPHTTYSPRETHVVVADAGAVLLIEWSRGASTSPDVLDIQVVD
jgi:hypothetical protein